MSTRYRRVSPDESHSEPSTSNVNHAAVANKSRSERISEKVHALFWVGGASTVAYLTDMPKVLLSDDRINRILFDLAVVLLCINTVLTFYLAVYLPKFRKIDSSAWSVYCPRVISTMTIVGIFCGIFLIRATWPVWGFLSPFILGIVSLGFLFFLHFIPWC